MSALGRRTFLATSDSRTRFDRQ